MGCKEQLIYIGYPTTMFKEEVIAIANGSLHFGLHSASWKYRFSSCRDLNPPTHYFQMPQLNCVCKGFNGGFIKLGVMCH